MKNLRTATTLILFATLLAMIVTTLFAVPFYVTAPAFILSSMLLPAKFNVLALNSVDNASARETFAKAKNVLYNAMRDKFQQGMRGDNDCRDWVNSRKLSQSEIRTEVILTTTASTFVFGLTVGQPSTGGNAPMPTEVRLNLQDSLIASEYMIGVGQSASAADVTWFLHTYGNHVDFAAATANALNSNFYSHGNFKVVCNNDVIMPSRGLWNNFVVPQTQDGVGITAQTIFPDDQQRGAQDGVVTLEPNLLLIGSKNYQPQIVLPAALAAATAFERAVLIFRGVLAQNSTVVS